MPNTIILRGDSFTRREEPANTTITPGMICDFAANDRLIPHGTSGGYAPRLVALECDAIGNGVSDNYASGDRVFLADCAPGVVFWAHLASGQNVARGAYLMSDGAGFLTARTSTNIGIAQADEDANASSGIAAGGSLRFRARFI
jgi:hypothetical protein